jgi:hypothetical protein
MHVRSLKGRRRDDMKLLIAAALSFAAVSATIPVAEARQGCGAGYHRGPAGRCRPNANARIVIVPRLVVGRYYAKRGYWDGRRYYRQRIRHHNGWRYR